MKKKAPNDSFFKTFVHQCNDLVVITDAHAQIVYVNPAFEKHTGYKLKSIKGKNISLVKSGVHNKIFYKKLWQNLKAGKANSTVFINKKKNGELYYEHKTITPIKGKDNEIEYYLSTAKDVTNELRLQKEILKQKNFIYSVIQNTDALITGVDTEGRITLFNSACEKLTGYSFAEVNGKSLSKLLIVKEERQVVSTLMNHLIDHNKKLKNEYYWRAKSGNLILVSWSHTLIKDEKSNPQVVISTGIDITKERESETKLLQMNLLLDQKIKEKTVNLKKLNAEIIQQNKFISKINRELPALVYLIDIEANTIRLFNNQINKKISIPENKDEDIPIDNFLKYINTFQKEDAVKVFLTAPIENAELPFIISGKNYWFQNRSVIFEKKKNKTASKILGFISDITKTKFVQNKLEESQKIARLGTWEWNIENNDLYWSDEIYRIFEINPGKFKPSYPKFLNAIHPEDRKLVEEAVNNSVKNKTSYEIIHRINTNSGNLKYVREMGFTQYSIKGEPLRMIGTVQDITEEKNLKEDIKSAYVTLQNSLNALFTTDLQGRVLFANNAAVNMWGFKDLNEMTGSRPLLEDYWPEKHVGQITNITRNILTERFYYSETPFSSIKKNNEEILVKFNLSVINNENDIPYALTWAFFDITDQVCAEKKVKEYDTKINLLLGNIDEVVFGVDATYGSITAGKIFYLSAKSTELMGFNLRDLQVIPDLWVSRIHPEDIEKVYQSNIECITTASTVTRVYRLKHYITGKYRWFEEKITPYFDESEELKSFYGSARDVSERVESLLKIKESEEKYRSIFENALVGIFRTNIKTQKPIDGNDVCIELFGYDSKEDFLKNFIAAEHYADSDERALLFKDLKLYSTVKNQKMKFRRKDGSLFWGDASIRLLSEEGIIEGVVVDVTKKHRYEEQLKKNLNEKELLLKEVHHRVKNNLQVISSLLKLQVNKIENAESRQPLIESYERIHAIALIHERLYLSDDISTINFSDYLSNLTNSMLSLHTEKDIKVVYKMDYFSTDINTAIPLGLMCYEIISNSFKHAFKVKKNHELSLTVTDSMGNTTISIADTGEGFDIKALSTSNTLGWKLINNLAVQAKAKVKVESSQEMGSIFTIRLEREKK